MNNEPRDIENMLEVSTNFQYPTDEEIPINKDIRAMQLLNQLAAYIVPCKSPRLTFTCLCYASGMDIGLILGCDNTESSICKTLGIPKQTFSLEVKTVRKHFNLIHSSTIKHNVKENTYKNNSRKTQS